VTQLIHLTAGWLVTLGPITVLVVLFVESLGIPAPSEIVLLLSGLLVSQHRFSFIEVCLLGALGSVMGATVSYTLAYRLGRQWLEGHARWVFRSPATLDRWDEYFERRGDRVVLAGRVVSGVRMVISYPAGLFRMPPARFFLYTSLGSLAWPLIAVGAGWALGPAVMRVLQGLHQVEDILLGVVVALGLAWWFWRRRQPPPAPESTPSNDS
jgi:membrane protein DedA with SNARE-associated domain